MVIDTAHVVIYEGILIRAWIITIILQITVFTVFLVHGFIFVTWLVVRLGLALARLRLFTLVHFIIDELLNVLSRMQNVYHG